jgi:hypothetical protein
MEAVCFALCNFTEIGLQKEEKLCHTKQCYHPRHLNRRTWYTSQGQHYVSTHLIRVGLLCLYR